MTFIKSEETQLVCEGHWENDPDCEVYRLRNTDGDVLIRRYQVFPGIALQYYDVHASSCTVNMEPDNDIFEIRHCREGRMEGSSANAFYYLEPGDLAICRPDKGCHCRYFPLRHYRGITIAVNVEEAPCCLSCFLDDVRVQPGLLMQNSVPSPQCLSRVRSRLLNTYSQNFILSRWRSERDILKLRFWNCSFFCPAWIPIRMNW